MTTILGISLKSEKRVGGEFFGSFAHHDPRGLGLICVVNFVHLSRACEADYYAGQGSFNCLIIGGNNTVPA